MTDEQFSKLLASMDQFGAMLERIESAMFPATAPDKLLVALSDVFGSNNFNSSEAWAKAQDAESRAKSLGQRLPDLPYELQQAGITNAHGLGRYLSGCDGRGVSRIGKDRDGTIWKLVISRDDETANRVGLILRVR